MISVRQSLAVAAHASMGLVGCAEERVDLLLMSAQPADPKNGRLVVVEAETAEAAVLRIHVMNGKAQWADAQADASSLVCHAFVSSVERRLIVLPDGEAIVAATLVEGDLTEDAGPITEEACKGLTGSGASDSLLVTLPSPASSDGGASGTGGDGGTGGAQ